MDLSLPEPSAFTVTETPNSLKLIHRASATEIRIRFWSTSRLVTETQCEGELRIQDPEAEKRERETRLVSAVHTQAFTPGTDYRGTIATYVISTSKGTLAGYVHGVAAGLQHCVSFDATTSVKHPGGEEMMANRLVKLVDGVAASLRLRQVDQAMSPQAPRFFNR
jgi:hypothetical protein